MTHPLAILATALLFGGMTLYSFGFAAFIFKALPAPELALRYALRFLGSTCLWWPQRHSRLCCGGRMTPLLLLQWRLLL